MQTRATFVLFILLLCVAKEVSSSLDVCQNVTLMAPAVDVVHGMVEVEQLGTGDTRNDVSLSVLAASMGFSVPVTSVSSTNRGDYTVRFSRQDELDSGVVLASVAQNQVDRGTGPTSGTCTIDNNGADNVIAVHKQGSSDEYNLNFATAFFGLDTWTAGIVREAGPSTLSPNLHPDNISATATPGEYRLTLPNGDSRDEDGVLLATAVGGEAHFTLSQPVPDGSWRIFVHRNDETGQQYVASDFAFVYVPTTTPGTVIGRVHGDGRVVANGEASVEVASAGTGQFRLTIGCATATSGTLIISAEGGSSRNNDNYVTYEATADGLAWIVSTYDSPGGSLQDVDSERAFSFVFLRHQPCQVTHQVTPGVTHLRIQANQLVDDRGRCNINLVNEGGSSTAAIQRFFSNLGDYRLEFGAGNDISSGIPIVSVGQVAGPAQGGGLLGKIGTIYTPTSESYAVSLESFGAAQEPVNGDVTVAHFAKSQGWQAVRFILGTPDTVVSNVPGSASVSRTATAGVYRLRFDGIDSTNNTGVLLVSGGEDENNFALSFPNGDGSWTVSVRDVRPSQPNAFEHGDFNAVFIPTGTSNAVLGRILGDGTVTVGEGRFFVQELGPSQFMLHIPCASPQTGTLLVSPESAPAGPGINNPVSFHYVQEERAWLIERVNTPNVAPQPFGTYPAFSFAFFYDQDPDVCASDPCQNGGTCRDLGAEFECECPAGFRGALCEHADIDLCFSLPCQNAGTCLNTPDSFECSCDAGHDGLLCEIECQGQIDGAEAMHGYLHVTQLGVDDVPTAVAVNFTADNGTYGVETIGQGRYDITSATFDPSGGVVMASLAQNRPNNGFGPQVGTLAVFVDADEFAISLFTIDAGCRFNSDVAVAYFPFSAGWIAARYEAGSLVTSGTVTATDVTEVVDGIYDATIPGVDSMDGNGVLLVTAAADREDYALSAPAPDGSWRIFVHDNGQDGPVYRGNAFSFVYVDETQDGVVFGTVSGAGGQLVSGGGSYRVEKRGTGLYYLEIDCSVGGDGTLLLSAEGSFDGSGGGADNIVSYGRVGSGFEVLVLDLPHGRAEDVADEQPAFSFAFFWDSDPDMCTPSPCENGATCMDGLLQEFRCVCAPGYTGPTCSVEIDECASQPCLNGGNCTDLIDSFSCTCLDTFTGVQCERGVCGDGTVVNTEACDDGNTLDGDGCASSCLEIEPKFICPDSGRPCQESKAITVSLSLTAPPDVKALLCTEEGFSLLANAIIDYVRPTLGYDIIIRASSVDGSKCVEFSTRRQLLAQEPESFRVLYKAEARVADIQLLKQLLFVDINKDNTLLTILAAEEDLNSLEFASQSSHSEPALSTLLIGLIAGASAAVLIAIVCIVLLVSHMRKKRAEKQRKKAAERSTVSFNNPSYEDLTEESTDIAPAGFYQEPSKTSKNAPVFTLDGGAGEYLSTEEDMNSYFDPTAPKDRRTTPVLDIFELGTNAESTDDLDTKAEGPTDGYLSVNERGYLDVADESEGAHLDQSEEDLAGFDDMDLDAVADGNEPDQAGAESEEDLSGWGDLAFGTNLVSRSRRMSQDGGTKREEYLTVTDQDVNQSASAMGAADEDDILDLDGADDSTAAFGFGSQDLLNLEDIADGNGDNETGYLDVDAEEA